MASTAAWSTASLSPKPILRAAAMAAASVTRTSSRARLRSGASRSSRASIGAPPGRVPGRPLAGRPFSPRNGTGIQGRGGLRLALVAPAFGCVWPPAVGPWRRRSHPDGATGPLHVGAGTEGTVGGSHGHGHVHGPLPVAGTPHGADEGLVAVRRSAVGP